MSIIFIIIGMFSISVQAEENKNIDIVLIEEQNFVQNRYLHLVELASLTREEIIERLEVGLNIKVQSTDTSLFDRYFLSYIYNYFQTMKPNRLQRNPYNLYSSGELSQRLVTLRSENDLYFAENAGDHIITKGFKEVMDAIFDQNKILPNEKRMTFKYSNELYEQLSDILLSSEEIKNFMNRSLGITFSEDSDYFKSFTREQLLVVLKGYLKLPVHIRGNLLIRRIERNKGTKFGVYYTSSKTVLLNDGTLRQGSHTFHHELGHALWFGVKMFGGTVRSIRRREGWSVKRGLSQEAREEYAKLSWRDEERINDEFISEYSKTNVVEDFAVHFSAYINSSKKLKQKAPAKYHWFKEYIFLNTEYIRGAEGHLEIFVDSKIGDISHSYFLHSPYKSFEVEEFMVLNLSPHFVTVYSNEAELITLKALQCLSVIEQELPQISLEVNWKDQYEGCYYNGEFHPNTCVLTNWLGLWDTFICSNTTDLEDTPRCDIQKTSIIKGDNKNAELILTGYKNEIRANFSQCHSSPAKREKEDRLQKILTGLIGDFVTIFLNSP